MSMPDIRQFESLWSPEGAGRFTPQAPDAPENPYAHLDDRMKAEAQAPAEASSNPYEDLDSKFNTQGEGVAKGTLRQFGQGLKSSAFVLAGGVPDTIAAANEAVTQKSQKYGTGAQWAKNIAGVEEAPENLPWYQRIARAEGVAAPLTAGAAYFGSVGGPLGALAAGTGAAGGVAASALAEPYIGKLAGLLPEHWRPAAEVAASALLAHKVGRMTTGALPTGVKMPDKMDIKNEGSALYKKVDNAGVKVIPGTINNDIVDKSFADIGVGADINAPKTSAHLNALRQDPLGPSTDIQNLTERYKALGRIKIKDSGNEDFRAANIARGNIKDYLDNLPNNMNYVTDGHANVPDMFKNWTDANANWGSYKTINDIESRWTGAKFKARSTYTGVGSNDVNAINQAFRPIVDPNRPNVGRNYTPTQKDMVGNILYGSLPEKGLRIWSKAAPDNAIGVAATAPGWLGALATGSPLPLLWNAVQAGGIPARAAAKYIQRKNIRELRDNVIQQSPLFKKMNPHIPHPEQEAEAGGIGAALGDVASEAPEYFHQALDVGMESKGLGDEKDDKKKEAEGGGGGYAMGHRLLKAVGGYDSSFFSGGPLDEANTEVAINRASGATPRDILKSVTSPTAQRIGQDIGMAMATGDAPKQAPIFQYRVRAKGIESSLPNAPEGHTRLWRGNRPGEVGKNPQFTNDLPGIALPFQKGYGGPLSYVDVPSADLGKYENKGVAARGAEFILPAELAKKAVEVKSQGGGYDDPRQEAFADPEAFRLRMARLAAAPQTGVGGGQPFPQTGIGGGMPMGRYQVGGYGAPSQPADGGYDDSRMPRSRNVEDRTGYDESKLHWPWTIHANEKKFYPQGDPIFQAPMIPPPVYTGPLAVAAGLNDIPGPAPTVGATGPINFGGGYDGVTGLLDQLAGPIVREHSQPWGLGRAANVLGQALGTMGAGPVPEVNPAMADVISPTQFGAAKSPHVLAPQYSTGKSDRLPMGNVPWPQVGGYRRRRGGYGMGQVSPLAGGSSF